MVRAQLRVEGGRQAGETLDVDGELTLGRATRAFDADSEMSRRHARFTVDEVGRISVEDLGSANGTFLNETRIDERRRLRGGDRVRLGRTTFLVVAEADAGLTARREHTRPAESEPARAAAAAQPAASGAAPAPSVAGPAAAVAERAPSKAPAKPRRPPGPSPVERLREQRTLRKQLPPFPNYTRIPSLLSVGQWWIVRSVGVVATLVVAALAFVKPSVGLRIIWDVGIPLLPILFFIAPGLWRNICPLAAANQAPRVLGFTKGLTAPKWLGRYGYVIAATGFVVFITLRKVGLQTNGPGSGGLLLFALASAFLGGLFLKGKSGWCSSMCPLLPVQRIYGQTPFALIGNKHCQPCVGCTKNCYDFNPRVAYLADLADPDPSWSAGRKWFVAAFPGLLLGFFEVPDLPDNTVGSLYGHLALYVGVSVLLFYFLDAVLPVATQRITTLYAAAAINIFYWFAFPVIVHGITGDYASTTLTWVARGVLAALTAYWVVRTYMYGREFEKESAPAVAAGGLSMAGAQALSRVSRSLSIVRGASIADHSKVSSGKPEITFLPDGKRIVADPGRTLLEVAEANGLEIEAGCRMGVCGADPISIVNGMANLSPVSDDERSTLERLGLAENARMACCCRVKGPAVVSLKPEEASAPTPSQIRKLAYDRSVEKVVVIGNGIAGMTAADYVRRNHPTCSIDIVAEEPHHLYNRMGIARLLYGRSAMQGLYLNPDTWCDKHEITQWLNTRATAIGRDAREVKLGTGESLGYDRLILATGSSSFVPPIDGWGTPGTFVLRSAADAINVRAFAQRHNARHAIVAGGGLLGLEAAYALHKMGLSVTVLESGPRLLRRQLDERSSELLQRCLEGIGLSFWTDARAEWVAHNGRLNEVRVVDGRSGPADIMIVATGIAPNIELARDAGLATDRGVLVDEHMRTDDERILAAGDVAQFNGVVSGLWPAAVDQGRIAAEAAVLESTSAYSGTIPVTVLKVSGVELTSIGQIEPASAREEVILQEDERALRYGKLIIADGRVVGAILLGYSKEVAPIATAVKEGRRITGVLEELRAGRWEVVEDVLQGSALSSVSVVGIGAP